MKNYFSLLFLFFFSLQLFSQTNTYILNDTICCSNTGGERLIDIDQDGIEEIKIAGTILTDVGYYYVEALNNNVKVTSVTDQGEPFEEFSEDGDITMGGVACIWYSYNIGDPNKFIGIQQIDGTDTIWSYIEIEFSEEDPNDNSCWDARVIVLQTVQNTNTNQPLDAGEIITSLNHLNPENELSIFPNPTSNRIYLNSTFSSDLFQILNLAGREIRNGQLENSSLDISNLAKGIYFIRIKKEGTIFFGKIIKI
ncbi:MAG: T9SS type A sorting domain-containing protein [Saprospiraceae bacterium]